MASKSTITQYLDEAYKEHVIGLLKLALSQGSDDETLKRLANGIVIGAKSYERILDVIYTLEE